MHGTQRRGLGTVGRESETSAPWGTQRRASSGRWNSQACSGVLGGALGREAARVRLTRCWPVLVACTCGLGLSAARAACGRLVRRRPRRCAISRCRPVPPAGAAARRRARKQCNTARPAPLFIAEMIFRHNSCIQSVLARSVHGLLKSSPSKELRMRHRPPVCSCRPVSLLLFPFIRVHPGHGNPGNGA